MVDKSILGSPRNFIEEAIEEDLKNGVYDTVHTRFPPEPNGYLHIGHTKGLYINATVAEKYGGLFNLRYDDTNPTKEDIEFAENIQTDIHWMGFEWTGGLFYGSDYSHEIFEKAVLLIEKGLAYVDDLSAEEIREYRGTLTQPGKDSPYRSRSVKENMDLFLRMKAGEFADGERILRAKIDMASPNINLRDPALYRIRHVEHYRTGNEWCIYPMYDFAHPIQDALEGITHSLCSMEYEDHRPLYNWVIDNCDFAHKPRQIEFARLNLEGAVMSKRYLKLLVDSGMVSGWDDPRLPTLAGLRRRGFTPASIRDFLSRVGIAKSQNLVEYALLEHCIREDLKLHANRRMAVLDPIELIIENYDADMAEPLPMDNNAENPDLGSRMLSFSGRLYMEREDFAPVPPPKYKRLSPEAEVRLMGAYIIKCTGYDTDEAGNVTKVYATYDPETKSGGVSRKVKGAIHWVDQKSAQDAEIRLYDHLLKEGDGDLLERVDPDSLIRYENAKVEASLLATEPLISYQFLRHGYFTTDYDTTPEKLVFNRTVGLKDTWGKMQRQ
ncbi:glutamine--tRNA ligase/YqeY domain fusion protein [Eubacteriales bacterium OttesenSCG-928-M02]|nr:glutamine--tRNA ligase/YqeY domain fusion protein [Eubacteriales bacterium OttesenSCG-928-M02]